MGRVSLGSHGTGLGSEVCCCGYRVLADLSSIRDGQLLPRGVLVCMLASSDSKPCTHRAQPRPQHRAARAAGELTDHAPRLGKRPPRGRLSG